MHRRKLTKYIDLDWILNDICQAKEVKWVYK